MQRHIRTTAFLAARLFLVAMLCLLTGSLRAQTNDATAAAAITTSTNANEEVSRMAAFQLRALTDFQSQMQALAKSLEKNRLEIANMLAQNSSNNMAQLSAIADMMAGQRSQDLKAVQDEHRVGMAIVVALAGLLLLSILFLNFTAIKAINRMTTMFSATSLVPGSEAQALADAREAELHNQRQLVLFPGEQGQRQLGNAVVQLQSRIHHLEAVASRLRSDAPPAAPTVPVAKTTSPENNQVHAKENSHVPTKENSHAPAKENSHAPAKEKAHVPTKEKASHRIR